jgi:hypothetical protein
MDRRTFVKSALASTSVLGTATRRSVAATDVVVPEDTVHTVRLGDGESYENRRIDVQNSGASVFFALTGSDIRLRNVGVVGVPATNGKAGIVRAKCPDAAGEILVENFFLNLGSADDAQDNAIYLGTPHAGHITLRNMRIEGDAAGGEDTLYGSPPGHPDIDYEGANKQAGDGGTVRVENCYTEGIAAYGWRLGSDGSELINSVSVNAKVGAANLFGQPITMRDVQLWDCNRGVRLGCHLTSFDFHDNLTQPVETYLDGVRIGNSGKEAVHPTQHDNRDPVVYGTRETLGSKPDPPAGAPVGADDAASGRSQQLVVKSNDGTTDYEITVTGAISGTQTTENGDVIEGRTATGSVEEAYSDGYDIEGEVESVTVTDGPRENLTVEVGGEPLLDRTLSVSADTRVSYEVTVSERAVPGDKANAGETVTDGVVSGAVDGGTDSFRFRGSVLDVTVTDGAASDLRVEVGGQEIAVRELRISGTGTDYSVQTTGVLERGQVAVDDSRYGVTNGLAEGTATAEDDIFRFSGSVSDIDSPSGTLDDLDVRVDGADLFDKTLTVESVGTQTWVSYEGEVTGEIQKAATADGSDTAEDTGWFSGGVGSGGVDEFRFFGSLDWVSFDGDSNDIELTVS